jgi:hypothetical protein
VADSILVEARIKAGERVIGRLDKANFPVTAAFWYLDDEEGDWRLVIASPVVDMQGPKAAYSLIHRAQKAGLRLAILSVNEIKAVGVRDPIVRLLSSAIATGPGIVGIRFSKNVINGTYIEDAYIYRLADAA